MDFEEHFREFEQRLDKIHNERKDEFEKLRLDATCEDIKVGDTVVVAAGPLNRGFSWIRLEARVIVIGQQSYKVQFVENHYDGTPDTEWIHPAVITDVIHASADAQKP